jgi:hypothetical protein
MFKPHAVWMILTIFIITINVYAEYSIIKTPLSMGIASYVCANDDLWYVAKYDEQRNHFGIGRLHVPTRKGRLFIDKDFGESLNGTLDLVATDSNHVAFLASGNLFTYGGSMWSKQTGTEPFKKILSTTSGKIWVLSDNFIHCHEADGMSSVTSRDSIGLSDTLLAFAKDSLQNIWVINKHQIAWHNGSQWKVLFQNDTMNFSIIREALDGSICFNSNGYNYMLVNNELELQPWSLKIKELFCQYTIDGNGNYWSKEPVATGNIEHQVKMTYNGAGISFRNAEISGWKNWPELIGYGSNYNALQTCNKHVYVDFNNRQGVPLHSDLVQTGRHGRRVV